MPKVRKLKGNYKDLLEKIFPDNQAAVQGFISDSKDIANELLKDLSRQHFMPTNGRTYEEHVATWLSPSTSKAYTQGNMTASFFSLALQTFIMESSKFVEQKTRRGIQPRTEDNRITLYFKERNDLSFAYFNDHGIPCGVSIAYSKLDPRLWTATIIRNTTSAPEEREILMISGEDILNAGQEGLVSVNNAKNAFMVFLNSKSLATKFGRDILSSNGKINIAKLDQLDKQYCDNAIIDENNVIKQLDAQYTQIQQWHLSEQKFLQLKHLLTEKYESNRSKVNSWYAAWSAAQRENLKNPALELAAKQSWLSRNKNSVFLGVAATITAIGFGLVLSGILAPFGLALMGATATISGAISTGIMLITLLASAIKISMNERRLVQYKARLHVGLNAIEQTMEQIHQRKLLETRLPIHLENTPEQITRAVLHANFSQEEFQMLVDTLKPVNTLDTNEDLVAPIIEEDSDLTRLFDQQERHLNEASTPIASSLLREVDKTIQGLMHTQELLTATARNTENITDSAEQYHDVSESATV